MKKWVSSIVVITTLVMNILGTGLTAYGAVPDPGKDNRPGESQNALYKVQLPFIENQGQIANSSVRYFAQTFAGMVFCTNQEIGYTLKAESGVPLQVVRESFVAAKDSSITGETATGTKVNYLIGKDRAAWKKDVAAYQSVNYGEIYDFITLSLKAYGNNVEKVFRVKQGGDPAKIKLQVSGADKIWVDDQGELVFNIGTRNLKLTKPVAYQEIDGKRVDVPVAYQVKGKTYGFKVGDYDNTRELVIDPLLASTLIGGITGDIKWQPYDHNDEEPNVIKVYGDSVYIVGTGCPDFPVTNGTTAHDDTGNQLVPVIFKFDKNLTTLQAATFISGSKGSTVSGISSLSFDAEGNLVLAGGTKSSDFPVTPGTYRTATTDLSGNVHNSFIMKMSSDLNNIIASAVFGGSQGAGIASMAVARDGSIYIMGGTQSTDYPVTSVLKDPATGTYYTLAGFDYNSVAEDVYNTVASAAYKVNLQTRPGRDEAMVYVAKMSSDLTTLEAATMVGFANPYGQILIDPNGDVFIDGNTYSNSEGYAYPVTPTAFQPENNSKWGGNDCYITKLSSDLKELKASTFLGGEFGEEPGEMILDAGGNVYITGATNSPDFPVTEGAYDSRDVTIGQRKVFVSKLNNGLSSLTASTFLGGSGQSLVWGMALDNAGNVFVTGQADNLGSYSGEIFPTTNGAFRTQPCGGYISKLSPDLAQLEASTYVGWASGRVLTVDGNEIYLAGMAENIYQPYVETADKNYPSTDPAMDYPEITNGQAGNYGYPRIPGLFDYPVTADAYQSVIKGGEDIFISKFDLNLSADPDAPSLKDVQLTATDVQPTELTLQWTKPDSGDNNASIFRYRVFKGWEPIANVDANTTSLKVTNLTQGQEYDFRVEAQNATGKWSTDGPSLKIGTQASGDSVAPSWLMGQAKMYLTERKTNSFSFRWEPAQDNVGIKEYRIYEPNGLQIATVPGDQLNYVATYLENGVQYGFIVRAVDNSNNISSDYPIIAEFPQNIIGTYYSDTATLDYYGAYLTTVAAGSSTTGEKVAGLKTVPVKPTIKLAFNQDLTADNVWAGNQAYIKLLDSDGNEVPADVTRLSTESGNIFVTPKGDLTKGQSYKITMDQNIIAANILMSADGTPSTYYNLGANREIPFTVIGEGVTAGPAITFLSPTFDGTVAPAGSITVGFSSPVDPDSINASGITLQKLDDIGSPAGGVNLSFNQFNTELTITPQTALESGGHYQLVLPGTLSGTDGSLAEGNHSLEFYAQSCQVAGNAALTLNGQAATAVASGQTYHFAAEVSNKSNQSQNVSIYSVARGGKGARLDHGGKMVGFSTQNVTINGQADMELPFDFTLPADIIAGNVYVDVFVWDNSGQYRLAEPAHFAYRVNQ